jgi:hypothetical protein
MTMSPLTDRCECAYKDDLLPISPHSVIYTDNDSLRADYRCTRCGRRWWTSWQATGAGWPTLIPEARRSPHLPTLEQLS